MRDTYLCNMLEEATMNLVCKYGPLKCLIICNMRLERFRKNLEKAPEIYGFKIRMEQTRISIIERYL